MWPGAVYSVGSDGRERGGEQSWLDEMPGDHN